MQLDWVLMIHKQGPRNELTSMCFLDDHPMKKGLLVDWNGVLEQVDALFMQLEGI